MKFLYKKYIWALVFLAIYSFYIWAIEIRIAHYVAILVTIALLFALFVGFLLARQHDRYVALLNEVALGGNASKLKIKLWYEQRLDLDHWVAVAVVSVLLLGAINFVPNPFWLLDVL